MWKNDAAHHQKQKYKEVGREPQLNIMLKSCPTFSSKHIHLGETESIYQICLIPSYKSMLVNTCFRVYPESMYTIWNNLKLQAHCCHNLMTVDLYEDKSINWKTHLELSMLHWPHPDPALSWQHTCRDQSPPPLSSLWWESHPTPEPFESPALNWWSGRWRATQCSVAD